MAKTEKMYAFTHIISETNLLAALMHHADEVKIDIFHGNAKAAPKQQLNGHDAPKMLEAPRERGPSAASMVLQYFRDHADRAVTSQELIGMIRAAGGSSTNVYGIVTALQKKGWIEKLGTANYKILKEGMAGESEASEASPSSVAARPSLPNMRSSSKGTVAVWAELLKGEPITAEHMAPMYDAAGLARKSISGAFHTLVKKGFAKRIAKGQFQITKKGLEHASTG